MQNGKLEFDLYRKGFDKGKIHECVLLAHGVIDRGRNDPRFSRFAGHIAQLGFAVVVPELPGMR